MAGRQDQHAVTVNIDGIPTGVWDTKSGGEVAAESTTYRRGGMGPKVSLGGLAATGNVTVNRIFETAADQQLIKWMMTRVGKGRADCSDQPLDNDANPFVDPIAYQGTLIRVSPGDNDSNSGDAEVYEIEIEVEGLPS